MNFTKGASQDERNRRLHPSDTPNQNSWYISLNKLKPDGKTKMQGYLKKLIGAGFRVYLIDFENARDVQREEVSSTKADEPITEYLKLPSDDPEKPAKRKYKKRGMQEPGEEPTEKRTGPITIMKIRKMARSGRTSLDISKDLDIPMKIVNKFWPTDLVEDEEEGLDN